MQCLQAGACGLRLYADNGNESAHRTVRAPSFGVSCAHDMLDVSPVHMTCWTFLGVHAQDQALVNFPLVGCSEIAGIDQKST
jgi:hypothetical protein